MQQYVADALKDGDAPILPKYVVHPTRALRKYLGEDVCSFTTPSSSSFSSFSSSSFSSSSSSSSCCQNKKRKFTYDAGRLLCWGIAQVGMCRDYDPGQDAAAAVGGEKETSGNGWWCPFSHDIEAYLLDEKPPDIVPLYFQKSEEGEKGTGCCSRQNIGQPPGVGKVLFDDNRIIVDTGHLWRGGCVFYEQFGICPYGILCRFGTTPQSNHISPKGVNMGYRKSTDTTTQQPTLDDDATSSFRYPTTTTMTTTTRLASCYLTNDDDRLHLVDRRPPPPTWVEDDTTAAILHSSSPTIPIKENQVNSSSTSSTSSSSSYSSMGGGGQRPVTEADIEFVHRCCIGELNTLSDKVKRKLRKKQIKFPLSEQYFKNNSSSPNRKDLSLSSSPPTTTTPEELWEPNSSSSKPPHAGFLLQQPLTRKEVVVVGREKSTRTCFLFPSSSSSFSSSSRGSNLFINKRILAPLTTVGNLPFRRLCVGLGAEVTFSEMALASSLLAGRNAELALLKRHPCEGIFGVQIAGGTSKDIATCIEMLCTLNPIYRYIYTTTTTTTSSSSSSSNDISSLPPNGGLSFDFIDLNCACPLEGVHARGAGSVLIDRPAKVKEMIVASQYILNQIYNKGRKTTTQQTNYSTIKQDEAAHENNIVVVDGREEENNILGSSNTTSTSTSSRSSNVTSCTRDEDLSLSPISRSKPLLTVKCRLGHRAKHVYTVPRFLSAIRDSVDGVFLHGRTAKQRYTKQADWGYIQKECVPVMLNGGHQLHAIPYKNSMQPFFQQEKEKEKIRKVFYPYKVPLIGCGDVMSVKDYNKHLCADDDDNDDDDANKDGCTNVVSGVMVGRGALIKPWIFRELQNNTLYDISASERLELIKLYTQYALEHWGTDTKGVETSRRFLLEWLSFAHRYIPVGLLAEGRQWQNISWRPPKYIARGDMETKLSSPAVQDWIEISEMFLGPVPGDFCFVPKHKTSSYQLSAAQLIKMGGVGGGQL